MATTYKSKLMTTTEVKEPTSLEITNWLKAGEKSKAKYLISKLSDDSLRAINKSLSFILKGKRRLSDNDALVLAKKYIFIIDEMTKRKLII